MRVAVLGLGALLSCAIPATAEAGTLINSGGVLTYTGAPGDADQVYPSQDAAGAPVVVRVQFVPVTAATGCSLLPPRSGSPVEYSCPDVTSFVVDAGDGSDFVSTGTLQVPVTVLGGPGDDNLSGGMAADVLDGGPGDDGITFSAGDTVSGGSGIDTTSPWFGWDVSVNLSLDGIADDGSAGAAANILPDVENIVHGSNGASTITGNDGANELQGSNGPDVIIGGAGSDALLSSGGADVINARDLEQDRVDCGTGQDTALVDQYDQVADSCETVRREVAANPLEDKAPTLSWAGAAGARLRARPATTLRVNAADDHGIASVRFLDDGRAVCTDTKAPFTCAYRPRSADVGRNTLLALVTDSAGQTASTVRAVVVQRFAPRAVSLRVTRRGDRLIATGKVQLPAGLACEGAVAVRGGGATGTDRIGRGCAYRVVLKTRGTPKVTATYTGTDTIAAKRSQTRRAAR